MTLLVVVNKLLFHILVGLNQVIFLQSFDTHMLLGERFIVQIRVTAVRLELFQIAYSFKSAWVRAHRVGCYLVIALELDKFISLFHSKVTAL